MYWRRRSLESGRRSDELLHPYQETPDGSADRHDGGKILDHQGSVAKTRLTGSSEFINPEMRDTEFSIPEIQVNELQPW